MSSRFLLFLFLGFSVFTDIHAQDSVNNVNNIFVSGGSVIMAVKAKDGIVIVSDSRLAYKSKANNQLLAYQDGAPKIFPLKKFAIGISGVFSDGTTLIKKILIDFDKSNPTYRTPEECLYKFGLFTKEKYPLYFKNLTSTVLVCAGYAPEQMIAILVNGRTYSINQDAWASNVFVEIDSLHLLSLPKNMNSRQVANAAVDALEGYIKAFHKEKEMGSLFSVLKIDGDGSWHWAKNDFTGNDYMTECEAAKAVFDKRLKFTYASDAGKKIMQEANKAIRKRCN